SGSERWMATVWFGTDTSREEGAAAPVTRRTVAFRTMVFMAVLHEYFITSPGVRVRPPVPMPSGRHGVESRGQPMAGGPRADQPLHPVGFPQAPGGLRQW